VSGVAQGILKTIWKNKYFVSNKNLCFSLCHPRGTHEFPTTIQPIIEIINMFIS